MSKFFILASSMLVLSAGFAEERDSLTPKDIQLENPAVEKKTTRKTPPTVKASFSTFTGKVSGDKIRMRLQPDLEGYIVRELGKNELVTIIGEEGDFYCIEPPSSIKAYIFRSFVLDNIVEGNRVNVRLEPDLEAPVIGHLNSGDRVTGEVSSINRKWLEIAPPSSTHFYVAKDYVEYAGGPELKAKMAERKETVQQLQEAAKLLAASEMEKAFEEIDFEGIKQGFLTIIHDFTDFPREAEIAKGALSQIQEDYLQKRIEYLEKKAALVSGGAPGSSHYKEEAYRDETTGLWARVEEGLFAAWKGSGEEKTLDDFYDEEKLVATSITGTLEAFKSTVKHKPGNYILKDKNVPVAYVYSTKLDLEDYVGKRITLIGSERDNHSFAFPAYFIHEIE